MKKMRIMMLFMSLFAITPVLLGSAWGIENRGKHAEKQVCGLMAAKRLRIYDAQAKEPVKNLSGKSRVN